MKKTQKNSLLDTTAPILPIGTVAITLGISQRMLRIYDQENILSPKRSAKNRRNYSLDDIERGKLILFITRNLTNKLAGVKFILTMLDERKIKPQDYMNYINKILKSAKITVQDSNVPSKRGRKPKKS